MESNLVFYGLFDVKRDPPVSAFMNPVKEAILLNYDEFCSVKCPKKKLFNPFVTINQCVF